ncbi:hypothetical protein [Natrinema salifodinae]|uniref:Uncharacterized protein n=1 Tax=Natrinema salifodinae TaxID=1202768 RepID=A0A1I0QJV5_9EURY|nr:hypothetical protein [Natrinema salifodinae]SEW27211.1 hypothetical protein SAMN05216285_3655 [Natrinema salifodinae]
MLGSRTATALVGLAASLLVSAVLWWQFETLAFFLFVPFVPFLFRGSGGEKGRSQRDQQEAAVRTCPSCGFQTRNQAYDYCPRDGRRLEETRR